jgi:hypothetical protein
MTPTGADAAGALLRARRLRLALRRAFVFAVCALALAGGVPAAAAKTAKDDDTTSSESVTTNAKRVRVEDFILIPPSKFIGE